MKETIKIFIASSAEVKEEREKSILYLNQINKSFPHLQLEAVEWEYDLSHGSVPDFETIQKAINPILEDCQICIFVFYSKIGKYTQEEFELTRSLKKKTFAFFKENFSPKTKDESKKYEALLDFKESLNDTLLYKEYDSLVKFELMLKDSLNLYLSQEFPPKLQGEHLSNEMSTLIKLLTEKQYEIEKLKSQNESKDEVEYNKTLNELREEKNQIEVQLSQSKEIIEIQNRDKKALEKQLNAKEGTNELRTQAFEEVKNGNFEEAKILLTESAQKSAAFLANHYYEMGIISKLQFNFVEAIQYFDMATQLVPDNRIYLFEASTLMEILGLFQLELKILQRLENLIPADDFDLSLVLGNIGKVYHSNGNYDEAIEYYTKSLNLNKKNFGVESVAAASDLNNIGLVYDKQGDYDKAIEYFNQSLTIHLKELGSENIEVATNYNNLGLSYYRQGLTDQSIEYFNKALEIDVEIFGDKHPNIALRYNNIGLAYYAKQEYKKSLEYYEKAMVIEHDFFGESHPLIATLHNNMGMSLAELDELDEALVSYQKALEIGKKYFGNLHPDFGSYYNNIGEVYRHKSEYKLAVEYYQKAIEMDIHFLGTSHPELAIRYNNLGLAYYQQYHFDDAIENFKIAIDMFLKYNSNNHAYALLFQENLKLTLAAQAMYGNKS